MEKVACHYTGFTENMEVPLINMNLLKFVSLNVKMPDASKIRYLTDDFLWPYLFRTDNAMSLDFPSIDCNFMRASR